MLMQGLSLGCAQLLTQGFRPLIRPLRLGGVARVAAWVNHNMKRHMTERVYIVRRVASMQAHLS